MTQNLAKHMKHRISPEMSLIVSLQQESINIRSFKMLTTYAIEFFNPNST
jgi:hypothetical protein